MRCLEQEEEERKKEESTAASETTEVMPGHVLGLRFGARVLRRGPASSAVVFLHSLTA